MTQEHDSTTWAYKDGYKESHYEKVEDYKLSNKIAFSPKISK
jgi:hypothetical protein